VKPQAYQLADQYAIDADELRFAPDLRRQPAHQRALTSAIT
jgi:hypothetical protein